jgi:DNA-binding NarL/FixJ family response regulator
MTETKSTTESTRKEKKSSGRALLVGNDANAMSALTVVLSPAGWTIEERPDLAATLEAARSQRFDLIVTSPDSSAKDDVEFLRRVRRVSPHTRVIILTDDSHPEDVIASMREHAFGYLSRDLTVDALAQTLDAVLATPTWTDGIEVISATPKLITLAVRCNLVAAERLMQFMKEITDLPEAEARDAGMAFREMLMNAMEHGGKFDPEKYVEVSYVRTRHLVMARIKDPGDGFSLEEVRHAAIGNPPDDPIAHMVRRNEAGMRPGGFGVMLTKNLVDELIYGEKGNEVLLVKYLPGFKPSETEG